MVEHGSSVHDRVEVANVIGDGNFVIVCEHAVNVIPHELDNLGLNQQALQSHIAWDPGAYRVALELSALLDAPVISPKQSRLVYDCNRTKDAESAIPAKSENDLIPGNQGLTSEDRTARYDRYYVPFHNALAGILDQRAEAGHSPALITIHSFAPVYDGTERDLDIGIIHDEDTRLADAFLRVIEGDKTFKVLRNSPYTAADGVTHTLKEHAIKRGLLNIMVEIRNDLINSPEEQKAMANWLSRYVLEVFPTVDDESCSKIKPNQICSDAVNGANNNDLIADSAGAGTR